MWKNDLEGIRAEAARKLRFDALQWWWCKHYNRPLKDPLLDKYTLEELAVERLMLEIEEDPRAEFPRIKDGEHVKVKTGDEWFDKLDDLAASGKPFALTDLVAAEDIAKLQPYLANEKKEKPKKEEPKPESFSDDYTKD